MARKTGIERFVDWAKQVDDIDTKYNLQSRDGFTYNPSRKMERVLQAKIRLVRRLNEKAFDMALMTGDGQLTMNVLQGDYRALLVSSQPTQESTNS